MLVLNFEVYKTKNGNGAINFTVGTELRKIIIPKNDTVPSQILEMRRFLDFIIEQTGVVDVQGIYGDQYHIGRALARHSVLKRHSHEICQRRQNSLTERAI